MNHNIAKRLFQSYSDGLHELAMKRRADGQLQCAFGATRFGERHCPRHCISRTRNDDLPAAVVIRRRDDLAAARLTAERLNRVRL